MSDGRAKDGDQFNITHTASLDYVLQARSNKNAHLKGRRRYNADLDDMKAECSTGLQLNGYTIKS